MLLRRPRNASAFTLLELLTVIAIILILVGISIGTYGYANTKAARSRAEAEVRALTTACENYKADQGEYPRALPSETTPTNQSPSDTLDTANAYNMEPRDFQPASQLLYQLLSGFKPDGSLLVTGAPVKSYFEFKPSQLNKSSGSVLCIIDPWGNAYGYSTARYYDLNVSTNPTGPPRGYNPTVDIWSTGGKKKAEYNSRQSANALWIKNW